MTLDTGINLDNGITQNTGITLDTRLTLSTVIYTLKQDYAKAGPFLTYKLWGEIPSADLKIPSAPTQWPNQSHIS